MDDVETFLRQSNYIEGEYSEDAYEDAKKAWDFLMKHDVITIGVICETHRILMQRRPIEDKYKGHFRDCPVYIGGREALSYRLVPSSIHNWCFETMRANSKVNATKLHVQYERIHPFIDGNGRTGRMFLNWTRIKRNKEPIFIFYEVYKEDYYQLFRI